VKKPSVFISYRRNDGGEFARRLHDDLEKEGIDAWLDVDDMPSGDTFIGQIDHAIAQADYFLLVATPQAIESPNCQDEWKKALEKYKPIIPLLFIAGDYKDLPQEAFVYLNDAPDFRDRTKYTDQLAQLIKKIRITPSLPGEAKGLPNLPLDPYYLLRPELLESLRQTLTAHKTTVLTSPNPIVGVHGMGGIGKSVLAAALARDYFVRRTFKDGILWLSIGIIPTLRNLWKKLAEYLDDETQSFTEGEWEKARDFFEEKTRGKEYLIVLDNVWDSDHVKAFSRLGEQSRLFVISRDAKILKDIGAEPYPIDPLSDIHARELLANYAHVKSQNLPDPAEGIIQACDKLPLALAMIGAMVRGENVDRWEDALESLQTANLEEIAARFPEYPEYTNLFSALKVSIDVLAEDIEYYYDFSIFHDIAIPENVLVTFWKPLEGRKTRRILDRFKERNLLIPAEDASLTIHNLLMTYIRREAKEATTRHQRLLNQYNYRYWVNLPQNEPYVYDYLVHHLLGATYFEEAFALFNTSEWMSRRFYQSDFTYDGYISDIELVSKNLLHTKNSEETIKALLRLALIRTSINSLNTNYSPELLVKLFENRLWSLERCIKVLSRSANHKLRAFGAARLLEIGGIEEADAIRLEKIGLKAIDADEDPGKQVELLKDLIPHLKFHRHEALSLWLDAASKISSNFYRAEALYPLSDWVEKYEPQIKDRFQQVVKSLVPGYWGFICLYNAIEISRTADPNALALLQQFADSIPEQSLEHPIDSHLNSVRVTMRNRMMGIDTQGMFDGFFKQLDRRMMGENAQQMQDAAQLDTTEPDELKRFLDSALSIADEGIQVQVLGRLLKWVEPEQFLTLLHRLLNILQKGEWKLNDIENFSNDLQAELLLGRAKIIQYLDEAERDNFITTLLESMRESIYVLFRGDIFEDLADLCDKTQAEEALKVLLDPPDLDIPTFWTEAISKLLNRLEALTSESSQAQIAMQSIEESMKGQDERLKNVRRSPLLRYFPAGQREKIISDTIGLALRAPSAIASLDFIAKDSPTFQTFIRQLLSPANLNRSDLTDLLSFLVPYLEENQLKVVVDAVAYNQDSNGGVANLRLLTNIVSRHPENQPVLELAQAQLSSILFVFTVTNNERETLLSILNIEHVLEPTLLSQEALQDITTQIIEICNEWQFDATIDARQTQSINRASLPANVQTQFTQTISEAAIEPKVAPQLNLQNAEAHLNRGIAHRQDGNVRAAIADYTEAIRLNPLYVEAYNNRALAYFRIGDLKKAMTDFDEAIRLNPQRVEIYVNRAAVRGQNGDLEGVITDCTEAIRLNPQYEQAYMNRGIARCDSGDLDGAIADCTEAIRLNPNLTDVYYNRGRARSDWGDLDGAIADFSEAIRRNPSDSASYLNRGRARGMAGDVAGGCKDFARFVALSPDDPQAEEIREFIAANCK